MGIVRTGTGAYERELAKYEQFERDVIAVDDLGNAIPPGNKYVFRPFPRMLFRAHKKVNGSVACLDNPLAYRTDAEAIDAEAFNRRCQLIVQDESNYHRALAGGWAESPAEAMEKYEQQQIAIGDETARRHYRDDSMSPRAQTEALAADRSVSQHLPEIAAPKKRRGRKPNAPMITVPAMPEPVTTETTD
jgi:hypothetical protein